MSGTEKRRVGVSAGELAFVDAGDPETPAVLLLHGDLTSSFLWRQLVPLLSPWFRVVAPDLPGHGDSGAFAEAGLSLGGRVDAVAELLERLEIERVAAAGHGAGAAVAMRLAVARPVEGLVLVDAFAFEAWPRPFAGDVGPGTGRAQVEALMRRLFDRGMSHRERLSEAELDEYLRPFRGEDGAAAFVRAASAEGEPELRDAEASMARAEIPVFVLWGEDDAFVSSGLAERLGDAIDRASVALLPGCGHFLLEDAPETVAPLIFQWLRSQYLKVEHRHETGPVTVYLGRRPPGEGGEEE